MIPSFHPVRRQREISARERAGAAPLPAQPEMPRAAEPQRTDPNSGLGIKTLNELLDSSSKVRYPDMPFFSYPDMLATELGNSAKSPFTATGAPFWTGGNRPRVAVVGGGMSGLLCAWQLRKLGASVDLYEASPKPNGSPSAPQGAGRIRPTTVLQNNADTRVEFGAMRFPDTSYLFWHYLRLMVYSGLDGLSREFTEFPNPGKVPTYLSGEKSVSPFWGPGGIPDLYDGKSSDDVNYRAIQGRHIQAFLDVSARNGLTLAMVTAIMLGETDGDLAKVNEFWKEISDTYYGKSYRQFLVEQGFSPSDIEVIGYLGVGTGGFAPLFDTSVLDVMRLFVWNYESEFSVPELYRYPFGLVQMLERSMSNPADGSLNYGTTVTFVSYHPDTKKYGIGYAGSAPDTGERERTDYDYVVCAMTHKAAYNLLGGAKIRPGVVMPYATAQNIRATSLFRNDIQAQQGMSSVKIFQTMGGPIPLEFRERFSAVQRNNSESYNEYLRVVFGKAGSAPLGVTYILPYIDQVFQTSRTVVGLQYSWGNDSVTLRNEVLASDPDVKNSLLEYGAYVARKPGLRLIDAVARAVGTRLVSKAMVANVVNGQGHPDFFRPGHTPGEQEVEGYFSIVDWDYVPQVNMGFKLDAPGIGLSSIYHFRLAANGDVADLLSRDQWDNATTLDHSVKGLYFCGCSFSHYGGWVEGAFQSALNATAGIVYAAAKGSNRLNDLSSHAKQLVAN